MERDLDFIAFFDCLHDMADPVGAARHARQGLKADGNCMIVEPFAGDKVEDNLNPIGRAFYGASSLVCVTVPGAHFGLASCREDMRTVGLQRAVPWKGTVPKSQFVQWIA